MESLCLLRSELNLTHESNHQIGLNTSKITIHRPIRIDVDLYVRSLAQIVQDRADQGCSVDLVTVMPTMITRDTRLIPAIVHDPVTRMYGRLVSRGVRRPRSTAPRSKDRLPVLIGAADLPVYKGRSAKDPGVDPGIDGGLHYHGLLVLHPDTRLWGQTAMEHFAKNDELYRRGGGVDRIDVRPVPPRDIAKVTRYCLKSICRQQIGLDAGLLILPRALSELPR